MSSEGSRSSPVVSIIIVNWNGAKFIAKCLESVLQTADVQYQVVVVDNASTDGSDRTVEQVSLTDNRVRLLRLKKNVGFSEANNLGAANSTGEYIALLNPDTKVDPGWLAPLLNKVRASGDNIVQSKLDSDLLDGLGDFPTIHGLSLILAHGMRDRATRIEEVFSARAASMLLSTNKFKSLGGFDGTFFAGYEDVDLGWRHRLSGGKVFVEEDSIVYHFGRAFTKRSGTLEYFHKHKNSIAMVIKNYSFGNVLRFVPVTIALRFLVSCIPLSELKGQMGTPVSSMAGTLWVFRHTREIWSKHLQVQLNIRKVPDSEVQRLMLPPSFYVDLLRWVFLRTKEDSFWNYLYRSMLKHIAVMASKT